MEKLLTATELGEKLGVTRQWVYEQIKKANPMPHLKTGKRFLRFDWDEVKEWLKQ